MDGLTAGTASKVANRVLGGHVPIGFTFFVDFSQMLSVSDTPYRFPVCQSLSSWRALLVLLHVIYRRPQLRPVHDAPHGLPGPAAEQSR